MKVYPCNSTIKGIPNYYKVYEKWLSNYKKSGNNQDKVMAFHYARVAEEMGQALIYEDDVTLEIDNEN